jgi:hypothetical protein
VRQRDQIYCLFAEPGSDKFEAFSQYSVGNARIKEVSVFSKRSDLAGSVEVLLKSLTLKNSKPAP